ncbi:cell division protein ZapA [Panacibacter sp. DH6]|uniref:Cell division protein ZapA n=1 Tax=Panacibacter microcysteis TaxID=2793269 RepID=A0A931E3V3_9BACT|nr:cell division protein ZapA [Panacibacter microcysteis]MBG9376578.1 cell division protein ZapA [Panacibacter microcysteis]
MDALIPVTILIGDRTYRLKIDAEDEERVRKSVKLINEKIAEFKNNFAGKDMQDFISMVLIWFATEQMKNNGETTMLHDTISRLVQMEEMIDRALDEGK